MAKLLPFEQAILTTVAAALPDGYREQFAKQVLQINKVQRLLEWNEIEFYSMRWFKVHWRPDVLFPQHEELELASGRLQMAGAVASIKVRAVGGHVFSIESDSSLKPFRAATDASFVLASAAQPGAPTDGVRPPLS